jgi:hypothetical protein
VVSAGDDEVRQVKVSAGGAVVTPPATLPGRGRGIVVLTDQAIAYDNEQVTDQQRRGAEDL